jgi:tRNA(fMet)-specific endonuclease VapC
MSFYVLDTDILTLYRKGHSAVVGHIHALTPEALAVAVVSVEEQLSGWYAQVRRAKQRPALARAYQQLADNIQFLSGFRILAFPETAILRYESLKALKLNIGKMDTRIAAIVLEAAPRWSQGICVISSASLALLLKIGRNKRQFALPNYFRADSAN